MYVNQVPTNKVLPAVSHTVFHQLKALPNAPDHLFQDILQSLYQEASVPVYYLLKLTIQYLQFLRSFVH